MTTASKRVTAGNLPDRIRSFSLPATELFSGGRWQMPMVVRSACGGWIGDGGQH